MILSGRIRALIILATYELEEHDCEARHRTRFGLVEALRKVAPDPGMIRGQSVCDWRARLAWAIDEEDGSDVPRNLFVVPDSQLEFARSYVAGADPDGVAVLDLDVLRRDAGFFAPEWLLTDLRTALRCAEGDRPSWQAMLARIANPPAPGVDEATRKAIARAGLTGATSAAVAIDTLYAERAAAISRLGAAQDQAHQERAEHALQITGLREVLCGAGLDPDIGGLANATHSLGIQLGQAREAMRSAGIFTQDVAAGVRVLVARAESVGRGRDDAQAMVALVSGQLDEARTERDAALLSNSDARSALDAAGCGSGSLADGVSDLAGQIDSGNLRARRFESERNRAIAERDTMERTLLAERASESETRAVDLTDGDVDTMLAQLGAEPAAASLRFAARVTEKAVALSEALASIRATLDGQHAPAPTRRIMGQDDAAFLAGRIAGVLSEIRARANARVERLTDEWRAELTEARAGAERQRSRADAFESRIRETLATAQRRAAANVTAHRKHLPDPEWTKACEREIEANTFGQLMLRLLGEPFDRGALGWLASREPSQ